MTPAFKISCARYKAMTIAPYFSSLIYKMHFHEVPLGTLSERGTLATTPTAKVFYEAEAVQRWDLRQLAGVIVHECMHLVMQHAKRCGARNPKKWNLAGDAEINDDLKVMQVVLPDTPILPSSFGSTPGKTAEEYYELIPDDPSGSYASGASGATPGSGQCGACSGNASDHEKNDQDKGAQDSDGNGGTGTTEIDMEAARDEVAAAMQDFAAKEAKRGRGSVPSNLARWANLRLTPAKVRWEDKLARACRRACDTRPGAVDFRFGRPSRRQAGIGFGPGKAILPGLVAYTPNVGIGVDTSGSMGQNELARAVGESEAILNAIGAKAWFIACDAVVHSVKQVSNSKELMPLLKGGGGTDFNPLFRKVSELHPRPEIFIFITDGCGPAPSVAPAGVHVIWLLAGPYRQKPPCSWGEIIEVD